MLQHIELGRVLIAWVSPPKRNAPQAANGVAGMGYERRKSGIFSLRRKGLVTALLATTMVVSGCMVTQNEAFAQSQTSFDIPAGPLNQALAAFGKQSGTQLSYEASLASGKTSPGIQGVATRRQALARILQGSGLKYSFNDERNVLITTGGGRSSSNGGRATTEVALEEISVYGRVVRDTALTIPQSVQTIDKELIQSTNSKTVGDALRFVPGSSRDGSALDAFGDTYLIRGFLANQTVNGIANSAMRQARDSIGIEQIEVLKGPASVLYGQLQPGAVVNVMTKQPKREWQQNASVSYGRFDEWRGTIDLTGPLTPGGEVRFRLTGAYDDAGSFVNFWHRRHTFLAPVLAFDLGDATTVTLEGMYSYNNLNGFFNGLPAQGTVLPNPNGIFRRSLSLTDPTLPPSIREDSEVTMRVEHRFSDKILWRNSISWLHEGRDEAGVLGLLGFADATQRSLSRALLASTSSGNTRTAQTDLGAGFDTGPFAHETVTGAAYTWFDRDTNSNTLLAPSLDLFAPIYQYSQPPALTLVPSRANVNDESTRTAGLFAQDRISLTDTIKVVGGARWSHYRQTVVSRSGGGLPASRGQHQNSWTSQVGLLYMPVSNVSFFANRTTSFLPVQGITSSGSPLTPETGTQYEVGAKAELLEGNLSLNGALFHLKRGNVAVADRNAPGFLLAIGEQVAKGVEVSAAGRLADGLTLYAGYSFTNGKTTRDTNPALVDKRIRNVPEHGIVLRGNYEIQTGMFTGLSFAGSAVYTASRAGDLENTFTLPSYWRLDAQANYLLTKNLRLGVSVENLTDVRYYTNSFSRFEVWPGAPRTWRVNLAASF